MDYEKIFKEEAEAWGLNPSNISDIQKNEIIEKMKAENFDSGINDALDSGVDEMFQKLVIESASKKQ